MEPTGRQADRQADRQAGGQVDGGTYQVDRLLAGKESKHEQGSQRHFA